MTLPEPDSPRYKRPESVLVVVYTYSGEVLMLRRTRPGNFWQSVTGSLRPGESPRTAARRELFEETGLRDRGLLIDVHRQQRFPILPAWRDRYSPEVRFNREHWFFLPLAARERISLDRAEHSEMCWLPLERAAGRASSWTNRQAIRELPRLVPLFACP